MKDAVKEAIEKANAELNNVALPNYSMVMQTLQYLYQQASLSELRYTNNHAMSKARECLDAWVDSH